MKLGIDVSYYNDLTPEQWAIIGEICDFVNIRLCYGLTEDSLAYKQVNTVTKLGLPYGGYSWDDPIRSIESQVNFRMTMFEKFNPSFFWGDYEQYWSDWNDYSKKFTPAQLNSFYKKLADTMTAALPGGYGSYSADWFMNGYGTVRDKYGNALYGMQDWIRNYNYWEARYLRYYDPATYSLLSDHGEIDPQYFRMKVFEKVSIPNGIMRQFDSYIKVKGFSYIQNYHLDWNIMEDKAFNEIFGKEETNPDAEQGQEEDAKKYRWNVGDTHVHPV